MTLETDTVIRWLVERIAERTGQPAGAVGAHTPFVELGLTSIAAVELSDELQTWTGLTLSPTIAFDYPTVADVAAAVTAEAAGTPDEAAPDPAGQYVAVVGIGCRFPGAEGPEKFWELLRSGTDAVGTVPPDRWDPDEAGTAPWGGFLPDVNGFDHEFFAMSRREAERADPQQRIVLEVAWEALTDAGIAAGSLSGTDAGVFVGAATYDHGVNLLGGGHPAEPHDGTGISLSIVANRLSYQLNARGPSLTVDTACSSSLVAVHLAAQALRLGETGLALAGGVNVITSPRIAQSFGRGGLLAGDGRCKPFDGRADGYVRSEGCGIVVLKTLERATADGDRIYGLVAGSAVGQDGRTNGLTAPGGPGQEATLRRAYRAGGIDPATVGYVEAHGTGTAVGDPIEVGAMAAVLGTGRPAGRPVRIGSAKSNIGHLEAAAGVAGLIKTLLAMRHDELPPTVHYRSPNPLLELTDRPVEVVDRVLPWPRGTGRVAGVSSFGFGGTNCHLILTDAPVVENAPADGSTRARLIPVSARTPDELAALAADWAGQPLGPDEFAAAAAHGRDHESQRAAVLARTPDELRRGLRALADGKRHPTLLGPEAVPRRSRRPVFVLPGQGSQWPGMGKALAEANPVFRAEMLRCDAALERWLGQRVWSDDGGLLGSGTAVVQPALFALQVALARTLIAEGVEPAAVVGHSMGEIAAAHLAGVLGLDDAARIVCRRIQLLTEIFGQGGLALVELDVEQARALIAGREHELSVAAVNGPRTTVLSGPVGALNEVLHGLERQGVFVRRIAVEFAAHSPAVEPLRPRFVSALRGLEPVPPVIPMYSTVTAEKVTAGLGPEYWSANLREPVLFSPAVDRLIEDGHDVFVEISPHPVLVRSIAGLITPGEHHILPTLQRGTDEPTALTTVLGRLYTVGVDPDWDRLVPRVHRHRPLPARRWRHRTLTPGRPAEPARRLRPGGLLRGPTRVLTEPALRVWSMPTDPPVRPELADHVVDGTALVPGTYWLAAAVEGAGPGPHLLRDVVLPHPCPAGDAEVQMVFRDRPDDRTGFALASGGEPDGTGSPLIHAEGTIGAASPADRPDPLDLPALRETLSQEVDVDGLYRRLAANGLVYGPRFRAMTRAWASGPEVLAHLTDLTGPLPVLLDSALHAVVAGSGLLEPGRIPLPAGFSRVWAGAPVTGDSCWVHAQVRAPERIDDDITADVTLAADDGTVLWAVTGLRVHPRAARGPEADLYRLDWEPAPDRGPALGQEPVPTPVAGGADPRVVVGDADLARRLTADTGTAAVALGTDPADLAAAPARLLQLRRELDPGGPWWVLSTDEPHQAPLHGLTRVLGNEQPDPGVGLIHLPARPGDADLAAAVAVIRSGEPPAPVRIVDGAVRRPRLVRRPGPDEVRLSPEHTVLITGGLGALGQAVARWCVERGARHLLLLSRSAGAPTADLAPARVRVERADVADREALRAVLARLEVPLGTVLHLAGVLEDAATEDISAGSLARVMSGKATGAGNLHELTRLHPLRHFVLFSSLAGVFGSLGQGAYAAANTYLDALARHRADIGLPALSIAWGPWGGTGLAVESGGVDRLAERGIRPLDGPTGLALLGRAMTGDDPVVAAAAFDEARLIPFGPMDRGLLTGPDPETGSPERESVRAAVGNAVGEPERQRVVRAFLRLQVAEVLRAETGSVADEIPFRELGFDSMMATELRDRLETALDLRLSAGLVFSHPTVRALTTELLRRLTPDDSRAAPDDTAPEPTTEPAGAPDDDLSESELARLLAEELDEIGGPTAWNEDSR